MSTSLTRTDQGVALRGISSRSMATVVTAQLRALTERLQTDEPHEIRSLRTGSLPYQPGSYGQYFTTWDFAHGILRDYSMNLYQLLRMAANEDLSVENILTILRTLDPIYSQYLGYSGFAMLAKIAESIAESSIMDRAALLNVLTAFTGYVNRLVAWSHHYFPWHLGDHYPYPAGVDSPLPKPQVSREGRGVPIRLSWQPSGIEVIAALSSDLNERLCSDFLAALPFTVLQDHAMVTGESMYAWTPLVNLAPVRVTERICDAPIGRLRYSQATGNKLVVQYGPTTETLRAPVLGQVRAEDLGKLRDVGKAVWDSNFRTKDHIWLTVGRL
jgi:cucumopine synthase-like protein